jgi:hypothetical protein
MISLTFETLEVGTENPEWETAEDPTEWKTMVTWRTTRRQVTPYMLKYFGLAHYNILNDPLDEADDPLDNADPLWTLTSINHPGNLMVRSQDSLDDLRFYPQMTSAGQLMENPHEIDVNDIEFMFKSNVDSVDADNAKALQNRINNADLELSLPHQNWAGVFPRYSLKVADVTFTPAYRVWADGTTGTIIEKHYFEREVTIQYKPSLWMVNLANFGTMRSAAPGQPDGHSSPGTVAFIAPGDSHLVPIAGDKGEATDGAWLDHNGQPVEISNLFSYQRYLDGYEGDLSDPILGLPIV